MTIPKMKLCPKCADAGSLALCVYDNGWRHVECFKCDYLGPGEGSILAAVKSHNAKVAALAHGDAVKGAQIAPDEIG